MWVHKWILFAVLICICFFASDCLQSKGKDFVFVFLENDADMWQNLPLEVHVINQESSTATVTIYAPRDGNGIMACTNQRTVSVPPRSTFTYLLCWFARVSSQMPALSTRAVRVNSNVDISLIGVNKEAYTADSFLILPMSSLGTTYYTLSYGHTEKANQMAIVSTADNTAVTVKLPQPPAGPPLSVNHQCMIYSNGGQFTVRLHQYETYSIYTMADIAGTVIVSSEPVAVFVGNLRIGVPIEEKSRDHLEEQLISQGNWDNQYVHVPIGGVAGDLVRIIAGTDNTVINYVTPTRLLSMVLSKGEWVEMDMSEITYYYSTNKFSVMIITKSQSSSMTGQVLLDPATITLPGLNQFSNNYVLPAYMNAASSYDGGIAVPYQVSSLYIIVRTGDLSGLRMDGGSVNPTCQMVPGSIGYVGCILNFYGGVDHTFSHVNGARFGVYAFSVSDRESLGSLLGLSGPLQCEPRVMRHGDQYDNDCDGLIDEEICDSVDNDNDGVIDEDCQFSTGLAAGRTYVLAFTDNSKEDAQPGDLDKLELYISPQNVATATTRVTVSLPRASFRTTVNANSGMTTMIDVPISTRLPGTGVYDLGLLVQADDDILVYALNKIRFSSESYLAIPVDVTGFTYYVVTYNVNDGADRAEFAVCASESFTTEVEITLANIAGVRVNYDNRMYGPGEVIDVSMQQYQCLQIQSVTDLTGSYVRSKNNRRLSVFSGNRRPIIDVVETQARDHIVEQLPPVTSWGREFYTNPILRDGTNGRMRGDIFRILASADNTQVTVTNTGSTGGEYTISTAGRFLEFDVTSTEYMMISSNNPVLVVQYSKTQETKDEENDKGDPSMSLVVPKESWSNNYRFVTPLSGQTSNGGITYDPYSSKLSITIERQHIGSLRFGNVFTPFSNAFPSAFWQNIPGSSPIISVTTVPINYGQYFLTAVNDIVFTATIYGSADREFYSNPISLKLSTDVCILRINSMTEGDNIDNDCDLQIDEEVCNSLDDDRDGLIDEDCAAPPGDIDYRYLLLFMNNIVEYPRDYPLQIYAAAKEPGTTNVRLRTPSPVLQHTCDIIAMIEEGNYQLFSVSYFFRMVGSDMTTKSVIVESSAEIDLAVFNMDTFSNDGMLALPYKDLGTDYRVITYWPPTLSTSLAVAAGEVTSVIITLSNPDGSNADPIVINPKTNSSVFAGQSFMVPMQQYEVLQLESSGDLSGTRIQSTGGKLAVISGNIRVGIEGRSRDHIVEMIAPWSQAGNSWNVVASAMTENEIIKFVCDGGTTIRFPATSSESGDVIYQFTSSGQSRTVTVPSNYAARVTASGGHCQMYIITKSQTRVGAAVSADPSLCTILPEAHYIQRARFTVPMSSGGKTGEPYAATLLVVARNGQLNNLRLDGSMIGGWTSVRESGYSYVRLMIQTRPGVQTNVIESLNGERFEARLIGNADRESFSYPLGMNLA